MPFISKSADPFFAKRKAAMIALKKQRKSFKQIGEILGVSLCVVQYAMKQAKREGVDTGANPKYWTAEKFALLCHYWTTTSLSRGLIAKEMGITKDMVVGKTGREAMPPRPGGPVVGLPTRPKGLPTITPERKANPGSKFDSPRLVPVSIQTARAIASRPEIKFSPFKSCQFIHGSVKADYRFCEEPSRSGSPYCAPHHDLCFRAVAA